MPLVLFFNYYLLLGMGPELPAKSMRVEAERLNPNWAETRGGIDLRG